MSAHYTVGGMPLAFTQEDFLVYFSFCIHFCVPSIQPLLYGALSCINVFQSLFHR